MKKTKQTKHKPSTRLLTLLLVCTMVFTMMPGVVWADGRSIGSREAEVIAISSQDELANVGSKAGNYKLTKDIILDDSWKEIDPKAAFTLDGNGHSITLTGKPLIGTVSEKDTTVSNLVVKGEVKESGNSINLGTIARNYKETIRNCSVNANVTHSGVAYVGGIVGRTEGTIINCLFVGKISNGNSTVYGAITNCFGTSANIVKCVGVGCERLGTSETWTESEIEGTNCTLITTVSTFDPTKHVAGMNENRDIGKGDLEWKIVEDLLVPVAAGGGEAPEVNATEEEITALATAITAAEAVDSSKVYTAET